MKTRKWFWCLVLSFTFVLVLSACQRPTVPAGARVWIDVPLDGLTLPEGKPIQIEGHASGSEGVEKVEIWINGNLTFELVDLPIEEKLARFSQPWTPPDAGDYTIQALSIAEDGSASEPDSVRIQVGEQVAEQPAPVEEDGQPESPTPTFTLTPTQTPTPTSPPEGPRQPTVNFWAEPEEIEAGACADLYWEVENAQTVMLGSTEVDFEGRYEACHCEDELYRLTVIDLDGGEQVVPVTITVTGSCVTPEAPETEDDGESGGDDNGDGEDGGSETTEDTQAPYAPKQLKPTNGSDLGCVGSAMLRWEAVSDESGIAQYQVELQRSPDESSWENVSGSPFTGANDPNLEVSLKCGFYYRWRVRAVDGAGNTGDWSGWFTFAVPIM